MIPRTFPSILGALGETKMVVYVLPSVSGLQAWKDYIPVKGITTENTAVQNTYANDGYQVMSPLEDISTKQAWKDYIPVFEDASYTKAWSTDAGGYIPASGLFSVYSLFANNEQGVWYDPSDLTTLFQDAAGTTPVTAVEQPVGLMLDKSKGLVLGPELVTNRDFSNGTTGWNTIPGGTPLPDSALTVSSGIAKVVNTHASGASGFRQVLAFVIGKWYLVEADVRLVSGTSARISIVNNAQSALLTNSVDVTSATFQRVKCVLLATETNSAVYMRVSASSVGEFDNISVKEITGNHAYQTTSANRPTLSARYNLLTKTEDFSDSYWFKSSSTTPDANTLRDVGSSGFHFVSNGVSTSFTSGVSYKAQVRIEKGTIGYGGIHINDGTARGCSIDLTTGQLGTPYGGATATAVADGAGWILTITATAGTTTSTGQIAIFMSSSNALASYTGTGNGTIKISKADFRVANDGVGIPAYQRVNTETDYDTVGFPTYLRFNGSSSAMLTNSIDFTGTDKMTVWAGVRKLSDAAAATVAELSVNSGTTGNTFAMFAPGAVAPNYAFRSSGTLDSVATATSFMAPVTNVLAGLGGIASDTAILRVNGTQVASSVADQGTGSFGTYPLYIGARAGTSLWFNGRIYSLIIRGAQSTTAQITNTEKYVNSKTKAY